VAEAQYIGLGAVGEANQGPGIPVSDGTVIHPGVALEGGYDSNVFYQNSSGPQGTVGAPIFRGLFHFDYGTMPTARLTNPDGTVSQPDYEFNIRVFLDYRHYFFPSSAPNNLMNDTLGLGFSPHVTFHPSDTWSLDLYNDYVRTSDPSNQQNTFGIVQDFDNLGGRFSVRPGGGTLTLTAGAIGTLDYFEAQSFRFANNVGLTGQLGAQWNFLPQTAARLDASWGLHEFTNTTAGFTPQNSAPLKATLGLVGRATPTITFNIYAGYGNSFSSAGQGYNMAIGGLSADWQYEVQGSVGGGYSHDFNASIFANLYQDDHFNAHWRQILGEKFVAQAALDLFLRDYIGVPTNPLYTPGNRFDVILQATATLDYQINERLFTGLQYGLLNDSTSFVSAGIPNGFDKQVILAKIEGVF
jgi:hypothetical protein